MTPIQKLLVTKIGDRPLTCDFINLLTSWKNQPSFQERKKQKSSERLRTIIPSFPSYKHLGTAASQMKSTISELSIGKKTLNTCSTYTQTILNLISIGIS